MQSPKQYPAACFVCADVGHCVEAHVCFPEAPVHNPPPVLQGLLELVTPEQLDE